LAERERREERKVVTVLFADLVGFTSRSEQLDVEDVRGTLAPFHASLRQVLEKIPHQIGSVLGDLSASEQEMLQKLLSTVAARLELLAGKLETGAGNDTGTDNGNGNG
jgi:class 3 adenylate cyclase